MGLSQIEAGAIIRPIRPDPIESEPENSGTSRGPPQLGAVQPESSPDNKSSPYPVIGNRKSHIYHRPECPNYSQVAPHNRVAFNSAVEAEPARCRVRDAPVLRRPARLKRADKLFT